jgi:hypothetical protein
MLEAQESDFSLFLGTPAERKNLSVIASYQACTKERKKNITA